jgi:hypothetical protein
LEDRTIAETACCLGIKPETARKRVARALDRLRAGLARRGITATEPAAASAIGAIAARTLQPPIHADTAWRSVPPGGENGSAFSLASDILRSLRLATLRKLVAAGVAVIAVGGLAAAVAQNTSPTTGAGPSIATTAPATRQQPPMVNLPDAIRTALTRNAEQLNPLTVSWTRQGSSPLGAEGMAAAMKLSLDLARAAIRTGYFSLTFQDGKFLGVLSDVPLDAQGAAATAQTTVFDGQIFFRTFSIGANRQGIVEWRVNKWDMRKYGAVEEESSFLNSQYFQAIGLPLGDLIVDLKHHRPASSNILRLMERGARVTRIDEETLAGKALTRVELMIENEVRRDALSKTPESLAAAEAEIVKSRLSRQERNYRLAIINALRKSRELPAERLQIFYLDPALNYAVRRIEQRYEDGTLLSQTNCDNFEKLPGREVWLPRRCIEGSFETLDVGVYLKEPPYVTTYEVTSFSTDRIADERFAVASVMTPGVVVKDETYDPPAEYKVGEDGSPQPLIR